MDTNPIFYMESHYVLFYIHLSVWNIESTWVKIKYLFFNITRKFLVP